MLVSAAFTACLTLSGTGVSDAQPVTNRVLSGYQIASGGGCSLYKINFNFRIRYDSHFPVTYGNELRILFRPIDQREFMVQGGYEREALRPPQDRPTGIKAIAYEARIAESPSLTITFDKPVHFSAAGGTDFQSLVISVGDPKSGGPCKPVFPRVAGDGWATGSSWGETAIRKAQTPAESLAAKPIPRPVVIPRRSRNQGYRSHQGYRSDRSAQRAGYADSRRACGQGGQRRFGRSRSRCTYHAGSRRSETEQI